MQVTRDDKIIDFFFPYLEYQRWVEIPLDAEKWLYNIQLQAQVHGDSLRLLTQWEVEWFNILHNIPNKVLLMLKSFLVLHICKPFSQHRKQIEVLRETPFMALM